MVAFDAPSTPDSESDSARTATFSTATAAIALLTSSSSTAFGATHRATEASEWKLAESELHREAGVGGWRWQDITSEAAAFGAVEEFERGASVAGGASLAMVWKLADSELHRDAGVGRWRWQDITTLKRRAFSC